MFASRWLSCIPSAPICERLRVLIRGSRSTPFSYELLRIARSFSVLPDAPYMLSLVLTFVARLSCSSKIEDRIDFSFSRRIDYYSAKETLFSRPGPGVTTWLSSSSAPLSGMISQLLL